MNNQSVVSKDVYHISCIQETGAILASLVYLKQKREWYTFSRVPLPEVATLMH